MAQASGTKGADASKGKSVVASTSKGIESEIDKEETFMTVDPNRLKENAVFVEESPDEALTKLLGLGACLNIEILGYAKHLSELAELIGMKIIPHLQGILTLLVLFMKSSITSC